MINILNNTWIILISIIIFFILLSKNYKILYCDTNSVSTPVNNNRKITPKILPNIISYLV